LTEAAERSHEFEAARLKAIWDRWSSSAESIDVQGFYFFGVCQSAKCPFGRKEVYDLIDSGLVPIVEQGSPTLEVLQQLTQTAFLQYQDTDAPDHPFGMWRPYRFLQQGEWRRKDQVFDGRDSTIIRTPLGEQLYDSGLQQASVRVAPSGQAIESIQTFIHRPGLPNLKLDFLDWAVEGPDDQNRCKISHSHGWEVTYDDTLGMPLSHFTGSPDRPRYLERIQRLPLLTAADIPIPRIIADVNYSSDGPASISQIKVFVVTEVILNEMIDETRFQLGVPENSTVIRYATTEDGGLSRAVERITEAAPDVTIGVAAPDFGRPGRHVERQLPQTLDDWSLRTVMIVGNLLVVSIIILAAVVRKRPSHDRRP
jgi:hypothetical protein